MLGAEKVAKNRLILRLDGGYGTREIVNYLLAEGYQFSVKLHGGTRAKKLVKDLKEEQWQPEVGSERAWALIAEDGFYAQAKLKGYAKSWYAALKKNGAALELKPTAGISLRQTKKRELPK